MLEEYSQLEGQLTVALNECRRELQELDSDDEARRDEVTERTLQLEGLISTISKRKGEDKEEVEIKEGWTEEDGRLFAMKQSGRRITHATVRSNTDGKTGGVGLSTKPPVVEKIRERNVDKSKVIEMDRVNAERIMSAAMERLKIAREGTIRDDDNQRGIFPSGGQ